MLTTGRGAARLVAGAAGNAASPLVPFSSISAARDPLVATEQGTASLIPRASEASPLVLFSSILAARGPVVATGRRTASLLLRASRNSASPLVPFSYVSAASCASLVAAATPRRGFGAAEKRDPDLTAPPQRRGGRGERKHGLVGSSLLGFCVSF